MAATEVRTARGRGRRASAWRGASAAAASSAAPTKWYGSTAAASPSGATVARAITKPRSATAITPSATAIPKYLPEAVRAKRWLAA